MLQALRSLHPSYAAWIMIFNKHPCFLCVKHGVQPPTFLGEQRTPGKSAFPRCQATDISNCLSSLDLDAGWCMIYDAKQWISNRYFGGDLPIKYPKRDMETNPCKVLIQDDFLDDL